jgi:hypothetical protein
VSKKELDRARLSLRRNAVLRMSVLGRAQALADGAALYNDPNRINTELDLEGAINAAAIQKAVRTYLVASNRVVVETSPAAAGGSRARRP